MSDKNWPESLGRTRMGVCIGAFDWSTTSLGPLANWPDGLRAALQLSLNSRFPMHIWWGPDLINLYNDASIPVLGKRHPAALGRPAQTVWAEAWSHLQPQVEGVLKRAESTWNDHLHLMLARNGFPEEAWFTWSHSPIRDDSGSVRGLHGVMIENTPRVLAEQSLERLSDERLRQAADERARIILESITEAFFALDRNWKFTYVNPQSLVLLGRPPQDLIGKSLWDEYPGLRGSPFEPVYRNVAATRVAESIIDYFPDHQRWYEVRAYPAHDGGLSIYFRDVSEQKQVEFDLADATRRLEAAIQGGGMSTWVWDIPANRIFADRSMSDFFQVPADQNAGLPLEVYAKMIHPEDRPRVLALLEAAARTGQEYVAEFRLSTFDPPRWTFARARVENGPDGKPIRLAGVVLDISQRRRAEEERERLLASERTARGEAERAGRVKDEFLATLSHELRSPLNAVLGWCDILNRGDWRSPEELSDGLATIERNARAQARIIADILDMSGIIAGKIRISVLSLDLAAVIRDAIETTRPAAAAKQIRLNVVLDSLPSRFTGDPNRLQQVFWNLLSNAVKFTPRGGQIQVQLRRIDSQFEIIVTDSGMGIKEDFLPHVFDRFRQADASTNRQHGGLGLGLSIAKQLIELHGGSIVAQSRGAGLGASFVILLPTSAPSLDLKPAFEPDRTCHLRSPVSPLVPDDVLKAVQILVVDDEPDARILVQRLFEQHGAAVTAVSSVSEALGCLAANRFDVLVGDIGMPTEDGYDLVRRVRALAPERGGTVPALALTAYARLEDRERTLAAGFQRHVPKPFEPKELVDIVAGLAGRTGTLGHSLRQVSLAPRAAQANARPSRILLVEDHESTRQALTKLLGRRQHVVVAVGCLADARIAAENEIFDLVMSDVGLPDGSGNELMLEMRSRFGLSGIALSGSGEVDDVARSRESGFITHLTKPVTIRALEDALLLATNQIRNPALRPRP